MIVGGYSLHLYCRNKSDKSTGEVFDSYGHRYDEFPHEFGGETRQECYAAARKKGWIFNRDGDATCPKCRNLNPRHQTTENEKQDPESNNDKS